MGVTGHVMLQNNLESTYMGTFKKCHRESFEIGAQVRVSKSEDLVNKSNESKSRPREIGIWKIKMRIVERIKAHLEARGIY